MSDRKLRLGAFIMATGHHIAAWRDPEAYAEASVDFAHYRALAETAERAKFDLVFLADSPAMRNWPMARASRVATSKPVTPEPWTLGEPAGANSHRHDLGLPPGIRIAVALLVPPMELAHDGTRVVPQGCGPRRRGSQESVRRRLTSGRRDVRD